MNNKWLTAVVSGLGVLVVGALLLLFSKEAPLDYLPDEADPGVIIHNYFTALKKEEYGRAYAYIDPELAGYPPNEGAFFTDIQGSYCQLSNERETTVFAVDKVNQFSDRAVVTISARSFRNQPDIFSSGAYEYRYDMTLVQRNGIWKIQEGAGCFPYEWQNVRDEGK